MIKDILKSSDFGPIVDTWTSHKEVGLNRFNELIAAGIGEEEAGMVVDVYMRIGDYVIRREYWESVIDETREK